MKFLLVDGSSFLWRAFSVREPIEYRGTPVGALKPFLSSLLRPLVERSVEEGVCIVFDADGPSFRNEIYPLYKANRPPRPADFAVQASLARDAVRAYGLPMIEIPGFEADDVLATLASRICAQGHEAILVSGDKDMMQLVRDGVSIFDRPKRKMLREKEVEEIFGVKPWQIADCQALAGDTADNVPGVRGIGIKTAAALLREFGSLDAIYENLDAVTSSRIRSLLQVGREAAFLSRKLVRLNDSVPLDIDVAEFILDRPVSPVDFIEKYGLAPSLAPRYSRRFPEWRPDQALAVVSA